MKKSEATILTDEEKKGFTKPAIYTYSGRKIVVRECKPEDISIIDIAQSLSNICRFTGHVKNFYSVAQHSVLVADNVEGIENKRSALLHDATEAYLNDLASPIKASIGLGEYKELEDYYHGVINERFNLVGNNKIIKKADLEALFTEKRDILLHPDADWGWGDEIIRWEEKIVPLGPKQAKLLFLKRFTELFPEEKIDGIII
jgi:5'-deoxynucleotidase YfbR-like HD superfamily hydrolase